MDRIEEILFQQYNNRKTNHPTDGGWSEWQIDAMDEYSKEKMKEAFEAGRIYGENGSVITFEEWYNQSNKINI